MNKESIEKPTSHKVDDGKRKTDKMRESTLYHVNNMRLGFNMIGKKK
jgi:hypothetical protein